MENLYFNKNLLRQMSAHLRCAAEQDALTLEALDRLAAECFQLCELVQRLHETLV